MTGRGRRVVLVGCGHAHLEVLRHAGDFTRRGVDVILVDPGRFWYSGLAGAMLGGRVAESADTIDCEALARRYGAGHIADRAEGLDRAERMLRLASGERLAFDLVSFNVGSVLESRFPIAGEGIVAVKPIEGLSTLASAIVADERPLSLLVAGSGATGCEVAGNLLHLKSQRRAPTAVTLLAGSGGLLPGAPTSLARRARQSLEARGCRILQGSNVVSALNGRARLADGREIAFDRLLLATGLAPDPLVQRLGLPTDADGLIVDATLRSPADESVFAAGDCASFAPRRLPKVGVYGVRAGPVLLRNLMASLAGMPLRTWRPQQHFLSILDLADGRGLAMRGPFWFGGRGALTLKNALDRRFLRRYGGQP